MTRFLDIFHEERLDQSEELEFVIPRDDAAADRITLDAEVRWSGRKFFVFELEDERRGTQAVRRARCQALWYRLLDPSYIGSLVIASQTPSAGLATILAATDWTVGDTTTASASTFSLNETDLTTLALIRKWAKITGTYVVWNTIDKTVHLVAARGSDLGLGFRYGKNLKNIRRRVQPPAVTVLYPYGAQDLTIAGVNSGLPYLEDFSYYTAQGLTLAEARALYTRSRVWRDTSFLREADLLAAAQLVIASLAQPTLNYEADVVDLSEFSPTVRRYNVADRVHVADPTIGIDDVVTTVARRKRFPLTPWRDELELSYLPSPIADDSSSDSRDTGTEEWEQFISDNSADYQLRNDGTYVLNRIGLRFGEGNGRANYHVDLFATGVGDGTLTIQVYDAEAAAEVYRTLDIPYVNGEVIHGTLTWASEDLDDAYDYRVRLHTTASGGADPAKGVNIAEGQARFYIMAQGAVQETPVAANSQAFAYTGAVQNFTVPDNVETITITVIGAGGGYGGTGGSPPNPNRAGRGSSVTATVPVTPGAVLDVYVGGRGGGNIGGGFGSGGWPDGGTGGGGGANSGGGGGGSTWVVATGGIVSAALVVAGGGGGSSSGTGGDAGVVSGSAGGAGGLGTGGGGGTQTAGGAGGTDGFGPGGEAGDTDGLGQGGDGSPTSSPTGAGAGGGWHGGGGGGQNSGGGGASGHFDTGGWDLTFEDAHEASVLDNATGLPWQTGGSAGWGQHGSAVISWDDPL